MLWNLFLFLIEIHFKQLQGHYMKKAILWKVLLQNISKYLRSPVSIFDKAIFGHLQEMVVSKTRKKQPQKHVKQTKFTQSCCKFSVNHSPRVQYVQLKSNSKKNFYLLDIFFILCIYFFWTNNKNQTIKHMHYVLVVLKYHSDTLSLLRLVPKTG